MATIEEVQAMAARCYQAGDLVQAEALCRQALAARPNDSSSIQFLGMIALAAGRYDLAVQHMSQSITLEPANALYHANLGAAWQGAGNYPQAVACYEQSLRLKPDCFEAHAGMGAALRMIGDLQRADTHCQAALRLNPTSGAVWNIRGNVLRMQGRLQEAAADFRRATQFDPRHAHAHNNLACTLQMLGQRKEAMESYRQALALAPNYPESHSNIAVLLQEQGKLDEAVSHLREAVRLRPDFPDALNNLGGVLQLQGKLDDAAACFRKVQTLVPDDPTALSNLLLCLNYDPKVDPAALFAEHRRWGELYGKFPALGPLPGHDRNPGRPLRIGYVSPDFRAHAIAYFLEPVLANHLSGPVAAICYSDVTAPDRKTEDLKKLARGWRSAVGQSDEALITQVRADRIDILVDLAGHTSRSRVRIFAHKPAPVQVTWLGYPNTTGVTAIDYCLTDAVVNPPGETQGYAEELFRLPRAFCCFASVLPVPDSGPLPALQKGTVTFGSLHTLARLNRDVLDTWCDLLLAVPGSRLLLFRDSLHGSVREEILRHIVSRGIGAERVDLRHALKGPGGYSQVYQEIDIALDTFPWSGHTTSCQALWMGVPVITLRGARHAGRMVASALQHAGLGQWIAETRGQYVQLGAKLAGDIAALVRIRAGLRQHVAASPLCDATGFTRDLEAAYRQMWRRWCDAGTGR